MAGTRQKLKIQRKSRKRVNENLEISKYEEMIPFYREHPVMAVKDLLGIDLTWYQKLTIYDMWFKNRVMLLWGRQLGKTFDGSVFALLRFLLLPNRRIALLAPVFGQQKRWFRDIEEIYLNSKIVQDSCIRPPTIGMASCDLRGKNGSLIESRPLGEGKHIKGGTYQDILIDEYLSMHPEIILSAIRPMMRVKKAGLDNKFIIMSSATFKHNHLWTEYIFYKYMAEKHPQKYAVHEYDYRDALAYERYCDIKGIEPPYRIDLESIEEDAQVMPRDIFAAENLRTFIGDTKGFISSVLLEDKCTPKKNGGIAIQIEGKKEGIYFTGIDPAYSVDGANFSIVTIEKVKNEYHVVFVLSSQDWDARGREKIFPEMEKEIRQQFRRFPCKKAAMDAGPGGGGVSLEDYLANEYTDDQGNSYPAILSSDKVRDWEKKKKPIIGIPLLEMVNPTDENNTNSALFVLSLMEDGRLLFPISRRRDFDPRIEEVANEVVALKREMINIHAEVRGDKLRFSVPKKYNKDRWSALCLAVWAAKMYEENKVPVQRREALKPAAFPRR